MVKNCGGCVDTAEAEVENVKKQILVSNKKYAGKFVAVKSFANRTVIASGVNPRDVLQRAKQKGFANPVVHFVPDKHTLNIY